MENVNEKYGEIRTLTCVCCGHALRGRQWKGMGSGEGLCRGCIDFLANQHGWSVKDMNSYYGIRGIHYGLPTVSEIEAQIETVVQTRMRHGYSAPAAVMQTFVSNESFSLGFNFQQEVKVGDIVVNGDGSWSVVLAVVE